MKTACRLDGHRLLAVDKISGVPYLRAIFAAWEAGDVVMPLDADAALPDGLTVSERIAVAPGGGWFDGAMTPDTSAETGEAPAQISMTSGTTGKPKAIQISRRALSDVSRRLIDAMALDASIREYVGVPVTFSFGMGRVRAIAAVGGKAYLPEHGFRAEELAAMLRAGEVNALCAVPTLLRLILAQRALFADCGGALRWLEIGSQYMSGPEKAEIRALFPNARIVQHYGLTEASRSTFLRIDGAPEAALESVGAPTGDVRVRIDADGLICIAGPHVADGRIADGALEALTDGEGWLRTSDRGALIDGLLHYHGRADDVLNVSGIKVSAEHFEQRLLERTGLDTRRVAVTGRADPMRGQSVLVAHLPEVDRLALVAAAHAVAADSGLGAADVTLVSVKEIPRTETGKVQRNLLTERYGATGASAVVAALGAGDIAADSEMSPREAEIATIWREALGVANIGRNDSFFDIGGDSLSAITVALRAEQSGMSKDMMQLMFEGRTVAEMAALMDGPADIVMERSRTAIFGDAINATRGLLVLLVIGSHWTPFLYLQMGEFGRVASTFTELLFHMGTPGFAMIFGVGLSFFYMPILERSPERLGPKLRANAMLLGGGVLFLGFLQAILLMTEGGFGPIWPEQVFFSVITSYFLIMLTVPLLLRAARLTRFGALNGLMLATVAIIVLLLCQAALQPYQMNGFANLGRLMLITPYSFPQMVGAVGIGLAIGQWLRSNRDNPDLPQLSLLIGLLLVANGILFLLLTGGLWAHPRQIHFFILYAGLLLLLFTLARKLIEEKKARLPVRFLMLIGLLSLPAYIGHSTVIPIKDILVVLGMGYALALTLSLSLFAALAGYAMWRLNRIYFPKG